MFRVSSSRPTTDWIGLFLVGAANTSYLTYKYIQGGTSGSLTFIMPTTIGNYEFRYFTENTYNLATTSNQVAVISNPPPSNSFANIWQGGNSSNPFNFTILANDDVVNPAGNNWFWIRSRVALTQEGDWVEYDYIPFATPRLVANDYSMNFWYFHEWGFYNNTTESANIPFAAGDKFKFQLAANNQVKVYKNGTLVYTYQQTRDSNKPLYIFWSQRSELPGGTTLKRPNFGGTGIVVD